MAVEPPPPFCRRLLGYTPAVFPSPLAGASHQVRLIVNGENDWQFGIIEIVLMVTCAGRDASQCTVSAMSSAVNGCVPA